MKLQFKYLSKLESFAVIFAGFTIFIISGYVWAFIRFFNLIF